jgi:rhamnogalacturonyl hydrolase YesR
MVYDFTRAKMTITVDQDGIVLVDYGMIDGVFVGQHRNPVITGSYAKGFYVDYLRTGNDTAKQFLINNADWYLDNITNKGNYSIYEYDFPYPPYNMPDDGWHDGLAQSRMINILVKTHNVTKDEKYLVGAESLLNSFFVEVKNGGVTYKTDDKGWWYEHYAHKDGLEPRVLNAHLMVLREIHLYYEYTNDPNAKYLFDRGVEAAKNDISYYDLNGFSYVDRLYRPAKVNYHQMHISYLESLYEISGESIFKVYSEKWENCDVLCQTFERGVGHAKRILMLN